MASYLSRYLAGDPATPRTRRTAASTHAPRLLSSKTSINTRGITVGRFSAAQTMATLRDIPLFTAMADSKRILVAGAGGGFDVYGGLPLAFALRAAGVEAFLANQSFSPLNLLPLDDWLVPDVAVVTPMTGDVSEYFPERTLTRREASVSGPSGADNHDSPGIACDR